MASVVTPHSASITPRDRFLGRGLVFLLPIPIALAIVAWWPRPSADQASVRAGVPVSPQEPDNSLATGTIDRSNIAHLRSLLKQEQERQTAEAIDRAKASTVTLEYGVGDKAGRRRVATGVVVSDGGDVLSVRVDPPEGRDRESILVRDASGHQHNARWMASDPETGLSLLKVEANDIRPIRPAARAAILGAAVFVIGNPYGLGHSVGRGHISGLARRLEIGPRPLGGLIQVQVPLHPGDSGALLADMEGGWLGLVRGGVAAPGGKDKDDDDLGFAIPAADALWVAGHLSANHKLERAFLGIKLARKSDEPGAIVDSVVEHSPAEQAKLQPGDRVIRFDDQPIESPDDLLDRLDRTPAETEVALEFVRDTTTHRLIVQTAARPPIKPPTPTEPKPADPAPALSRALLERFDQFEKQLDEIRRREHPTETP